MSEFKEVSLDELEEGIESATSFNQLINTLRNLQARHGNHRQLFDTHMNDIIFNLEEIRDSCQNGVEFDAIRYTRFNRLPDSLITAKAVDIASKQYEEDYTVDRNGKIVEK